MFDFAWSEIALIGIVALVAIGPKDLPVAIKTVADMVKKARRMAGEFQTHVDEMVREANLHEVRDTIAGIRNMDIKGKILDAVDGDGALRKTIADRPFDLNPAPPPVPVPDTAVDTIALQDATADALTEPVASLPMPQPVVPRGPPSFIPPQLAAAGKPPPRRAPPAFVPPAVVALSRPALPYA